MVQRAVDAEGDERADAGDGARHGLVRAQYAELIPGPGDAGDSRVVVVVQRPAWDGRVRGQLSQTEQDLVPGEFPDGHERSLSGVRRDSGRHAFPSFGIVTNKRDRA